MIRRLFCYGTLQVPGVIRALIGRVPVARPATLPDYRRGQLVRRRWPGVTPEPGTATSGTLYEGLTARELKRLDRYEGAEYRRAAVRVRVSTGMRQGWVYRPRLAPGNGLGASPQPSTNPARWRAAGLPAGQRGRHSRPHQAI